MADSNNKNNPAPSAEASAEANVDAARRRSCKRALQAVVVKLDCRLRASGKYSLLLALATLYIVFLDDVRFGLVAKSGDLPLRVVFFLCFALFVLDISLSLVAERGYSRSMIFVLDALATLSMVLHPFFSNAGAVQSLGLARLARLTRIVRVIRMARMARAAFVSTDMAMTAAGKARAEASGGRALGRAASGSTALGQSSFSMARPPPNHAQPAAIKRESSLREVELAVRTRQSTLLSLSSGISAEDDGHDHAPGGGGGGGGEVPNRSLIGQTLMQTTTLKIILLVLLLVAGIQLLQPTPSDRTVETGLQSLHVLFAEYNATGCFDTELDPGAALCVEAPCCEAFEVLLDTYQAGTRFEGVSAGLRFLQLHGVVFLSKSTSDLRDSQVLEHDFADGASRVRLDISDQLAINAAWTAAQNVLVLGVLLVFPYLFGQDVYRLVVTPLEVIFDRVRTIAEHPDDDVDVNTAHDGRDPNKRYKRSKTYELDMISSSLSRLTRLLQVSLGRAGTAIIGHNLRTGTFSPLQGGTRVHAVFVFCEICEFDEYCRALQGEVVTFVNTVAAVVAAAVQETGGDVNKNLGGAFLLVWRSGHAGGGAQSLAKAANSALRACLAIARNVRKTKRVQNFAEQGELKQRLRSGKGVHVRFGLHAGWAIEGAVGSEQKIDATYLSPTVNTAARLQTATKHYHTNLLMSDAVFGPLEEATKQRCRAVDRIAVKGSTQPVTIYTFEAGADGKVKVQESAEICERYFAGEWGAAKGLLERFFQRYPGDATARVLWDAMEEYGFVAPDDWAGVRKMKKK